MPSTTAMVPFRGEKDRLQGYLAMPQVTPQGTPQGAGPFPGVVVIHEAFGLNENIKDIARRFADTGYAAFAVDLFAGRSRAVCMARFLGGALRGNPEPFGVRDLKAALSTLADQPGVDGDRIWAIGFCMGGGYAIAWACADDRLEAVARSCPVVGSYPEKDFTARSGRKLNSELRRHGIPRDIKIYPRARHSFFNDRIPAHDPAASDRTTAGP